MRHALRALAIVFVLAVSAFAQQCAGASLSPNVVPVGCTQFLGYSGTTLTYTCLSPSVLTTPQSTRQRTRVSISAASNANPVVFTSTAHGFVLTSRPSITITGGTGSWTAINGTFTATTIDANTFSIPVDSTAFGALAGTITFNTTAPRLGQPEWAVSILTTTANLLVATQWLGGVNTYTSKCTDGTSASVNVQ